MSVFFRFRGQTSYLESIIPQDFHSVKHEKHPYSSVAHLPRGQQLSAAEVALPRHSCYAESTEKSTKRSEPHEQLCNRRGDTHAARKTASDAGAARRAHQRQRQDRFQVGDRARPTARTTASSLCASTPRKTPKRVFSAAAAAFSTGTATATDFFRSACNFRTLKTAGFPCYPAVFGLFLPTSEFPSNFFKKTFKKNVDKTRSGMYNNSCR